jgi:hypothetical protein
VVQVSVLYFAGCPNWEETGRRLRRALDLLGQAGTPVGFVQVETEAEAAEVDFHGSPTITVDGEDLFPGGGVPGAASCRVYSGFSGLAGVPEAADVVAALAERIDR